MLPDGPDALWRLEIVTDAERLEVSFPPAFVHDRTATWRCASRTGASSYPREAEDGYVAEWRALGVMPRGDVDVEYEELLDDARYGLRLADAAARDSNGARRERGRRRGHGDSAYRVAISELPLRTRARRAIPGSIVIVPGEGGWCDARSAPSASGAAASSSSRPAGGGAGATARRTAAAGLPVVLERTFLRADAAADARRARRRS